MNIMEQVAAELGIEPQYQNSIWDLTAKKYRYKQGNFIFNILYHQKYVSIRTCPVSLSFKPIMKIVNVISVALQLGHLIFA